MYEPASSLTDRVATLKLELPLGNRKVLSSLKVDDLLYHR